VVWGRLVTGFANDGTAINGHGGTEMIRNGILERCDPKLLSGVKIIHSRVRDEFFEEGKKHILVLHDTWNDPEAQHLRDPESRKRFDKLVFVSEQQFQSYHMGHGIPYSESVVIKNAIDPIMTSNKGSGDDPIKLIYHTTPHRGLELLVPVFMKLYEVYGRAISLDVFSSFAAYGWKERDEPYEALFEECRKHDGINYHGFVDNNIVREALSTTDVFAYPCIWPETSCIAAIEAISARCIVVAPNLAVLPETVSKGMGIIYSWDEDRVKHANVFAEVLYATIGHIISYRGENVMQDWLDSAKKNNDNSHSWANAVPAWNRLLATI
jgi:UDP-glucose:(glucosyl)LPS alpha-1,2-glucosyltransferase